MQLQGFFAMFGPILTKKSYNLLHTTSLFSIVLWSHILNLDLMKNNNSHLWNIFPVMQDLHVYRYREELKLTCFRSLVFHVNGGASKDYNRNTQSYLTHWGQDKMAAILQPTLSNAFSCKKMYEFRLQFHWGLFLRAHLTIFRHWSR